MAGASAPNSETNRSFTTGADLVFWSASAFLIGVLAAGVGLNFYFTLGILAALALAVRCALRSRIADLKFFLFLIPVFLGFFYYHFRINLEAVSERIVFNRVIDFSGVVVAEPQVKEKFQEIIIELRDPLAGRVKILVKPTPEFGYGDLVLARGTIEPKAEEGRGVASTFFPKVRVLGYHQGSQLKENLLNFKKLMIGKFHEFLPTDRGALLTGLTFGARAEFTSELRSQMALSGTTHLVALSGYNIAVLVLAVAGVLGYFLRRRWTFYFTAVVISLFVLMVGAEASVLRAAVMGFLVLLAREAGRIYSFRNAIALAALIMVLISPVILVSDLGFILSFMSLLGIVYLGPALKRLLRMGGDDGFLNWRENFITTLSAQLAVLPIIVQNFGSFNLLALVANILILAFVPLTMFLGFALAAGALVFYYSGFFLAELLNILLAYELGVIKLFSYIRLPIPGVFSGAAVFVIYYIILTGLIVTYPKKRNEKV